MVAAQNDGLHGSCKTRPAFNLTTSLIALLLSITFGTWVPTSSATLPWVFTTPTAEQDNTAPQPQKISIAVKSLLSHYCHKSKIFTGSTAVEMQLISMRRLVEFPLSVKHFYSPELLIGYVVALSLCHQFLRQPDPHHLVWLWCLSWLLIHLIVPNHPGTPQCCYSGLANP